MKRQFLAVSVQHPFGTFHAALLPVDAIKSVQQASGEAVNALITMDDATGYFVAESIEEIAKQLR